MEVLVKLPSAAQTLQVARVLDQAFDEHTAGWELDSDGTWTKLAPTDGTPMVDLQERLINAHRRRRTTV